MPANSAAAKGGGRGGRGEERAKSFKTRTTEPRRSPSAEERAEDDGELVVDLAPPPLAPLNEITLADGRKVEDVASDLLKAEQPGKWLIDPRRSKFIMVWDVVTTVALIFTATVTPVEVALLSPAWNALFVINRLVDVIFSWDIFMTFFTMYEVVSQSINKQGKWIKDHRQIAKHYLCGWFALDTFSVGVSFVDIYSVWSNLAAESCSPEAAPCSAAAAKGASLSALKTLRILRLFKLIRLLRSSRIAARWETRVAVDYAMVEIVKCILKVVCCSHWMACFWCLQAHMTPGGPLGDLSSASPVASWLGEEDYCRRDALSPEGWVCDDWGSIYTAAVYWSVMTITSIGYGDIAATPKNTAEMWVGVMLMMVSSLIWASVIGTYCGVVATLNPDRAAFHEMIQELNRFMVREDLEPGLQFRLREYFHRSRHLRMANAQRRLLEQMPPMLKGEVAWATCHSWLSSIYFLKGAPKEFMVELALCLQAMVYAPDDQPEHDYLYIVHAGIALYQARVVTKGQCFGEDIILVSPHLRVKARARAIDYLEVFYVARSELLHVAARYPMVARSIRRAAILIALRREMILIAKRQMGVMESEKISMFKLLNQVQIDQSAKRGTSLVEHYCGKDVGMLQNVVGNDACAKSMAADSAASRKPSSDGSTQGAATGSSSASAASSAPAASIITRPSIFPGLLADPGRGGGLGGSAPPPTPTEPHQKSADGVGATAAELRTFAAQLQAQHKMEVAALKAELKVEMGATHALVLESNRRLAELLAVGGGAPSTAGAAVKKKLNLAGRKMRPQKV